MEEKEKYLKLQRAARDFLRVSFMPSAIVSAATHGGKTAVRVYGKY